ncbi:MAG: zinc ribbon domain-containing protein, partial [Oscillospiraceae bacterium]|nr:zinc ribbon domain-containing protein [Oscillospiraceae bacterium]
MFCERCGSPLKEGYKFCGNCGTPVPAAAPVPVSLPPVDIGSIDMQTAEGMLAFARQFSPANLPVYINAFQEVEKNLLPNEKVHFAFIGTSLTRRQTAMLWYVGVAITDTRLLIGGQIKGMLKVSYSAQSFTLDNINSVSEAYSAIIGGDLVIDTLGDDLRIGQGSREIVNNLMPKINKVLMELK